MMKLQHHRNIVINNMQQIKNVTLALSAEAGSLKSYTIIHPSSQIF